MSASSGLFSLYFLLFVYQRSFPFISLPASLAVPPPPAAGLVSFISFHLFPSMSPLISIHLSLFVVSPPPEFSLDFLPPLRPCLSSFTSVAVSGYPVFVFFYFLFFVIPISVAVSTSSGLISFSFLFTCPQPPCV